MIKQWFINLFIDLPYEDRAYKAGFIAFGAYIIIGGVALLIFGNGALNIVAGVSVYLIAATFTTAVVIEFWKLISKAIENKYVKLLSAGLVLFAYKLSELKAHDITHQITSYDPSSFSNATSLLTAFYLPYAWFLLLFSALVFLIIFWWIFFPIKASKIKSKFEDAKNIARLFGLLVVFLFTANAMQLYETKDSITYKFAKYIVLQSEYHPNKACSNFSEKYFIADIGRGYVSRFNITNHEFDTYSCQIGVTSN